MAEEEVKSKDERNNGGIRITTWNVNGIRNPFGYQPWRENRTFPAMFDTLESDIVIMQELKIQRKDLRDDMVLLDGWDCFFSLPKHKKGYSGVGIYTRQSTCVPIKAEEGVLGVLCPPGKSERYCDLPSEHSIGGYPTSLQLLDIGVDPIMLDSEGRCVVLEFPAFVIFGVYSPANSNGLRDDFRIGFLKALDARIRNLRALGKRVILTGDLNVSRDEKDSARAEEENRKQGITHEEYVSTPNRRIFNALIDGGEVYGEKDQGREEPIFSDVIREFHPNRKGMFTHWEQKINARPGNFGSRIDFILASISMRDWFSDANIQEGLMGSDHCPVYATIKSEIVVEGEKIHSRDLMHPKGVFENGQRKRVVAIKDLLPFSGKLLPEFDRRRTIKDMFRAAPASSATSATNATTATPATTATKAVTPVKSRPSATAPAKRRKTSDQQTLQSFFQPNAVKKKDVEVKDENTTGESPERFVDNFAARDKWNTLFTKEQVLCEHGEPCLKLQSKVKGANQKRWFLMCSRPLGPNGQKTGGEWRCKTFLWCSDLK